MKCKLLKTIEYNYTTISDSNRPLAGGGESRPMTPEIEPSYKKEDI